MANPIRHSVSPTMHNNAFVKLGLNGLYLCFEVEGDRLEGAVKAIRTLGMRGANVSMPNKKAIIPYLDKLDKTAEMCGAVNTVVNAHGVLAVGGAVGIGGIISILITGPVSDKFSRRISAVIGHLGWATYYIGLLYRVVFMATGIFYLALAVILLFAPYPSQVAKAKAETQAATAQKHRFNVGTVCLILMGFTTTAAFLLWINTYQELARSYGISQPSTLQSVYAIGASVAVLFNSLIVKKGVKEIDILIYYPLITAIGLALAYFIQKPWILYVTSVVS